MGSEEKLRAQQDCAVTETLGGPWKPPEDRLPLTVGTKLLKAASLKRFPSASPTDCEVRSTRIQ